MHDFLESLELFGVTEYRSAQFLPVDSVRSGRPGKFRRDGRQQRTARSLQFVDGSIGIEHRYPQITHHARHGRLAHADRTGEAEDGLPLLFFCHDRIRSRNV